MIPLSLLLFIGLCSGQESLLDVYVSEPSYSSDDPENTLNLTVISDGPLIIMTPSPEMYTFGANTGQFKMIGFYAFKGLAALGKFKNFQYLQDMLLSTDTSGLAYPGGSFTDLEELNGVLEKMILPDNFRTSEIIEAVQDRNAHVLYVAPAEFFKKHQFSGLKHVAKFLISGFSVEPVFSADPSLKRSKTAYSDPEHRLADTFPVISRFPVYVDQVLYRRYRHVAPSSVRRWKRNDEGVEATAVAP